MATVELGVDVLPGVADFLSRPQRMPIGGEWVEAASGRSFDTEDPALARVLTTVPEGDAADVDRAVTAARRALEEGPWPAMTAAERSRVVWRIGDLVSEHAEELAQLETLDAGKSLALASAVDLPLAAESFRYMAGWATKLRGSTLALSVPYTPGATYHAYTLRQPVGVVGAIIPWNFPLVMAAWKLAPALATGNTVVLKPAEQTPLSALFLGALLEEAGLPPGVVNIVTGYGETAGAALAAHPGVDKVAFTGSTEVGRLILAAAGGNLKKVSLELGGKSPNVIFADADMEAAVPGAANAVFFHQGQLCTAGSRLYVEDTAFDDVVGALAGAAGGIQLGHGFDPATQLGPLVSAEQLERVTGYVAAGEAEGARAVAGGRRHGEQGYFVQPTVMVDTKPDMKVVREEIFGPVVVAMPFSGEDVLAAANDSRFGLAAGVWTRDVSKAHRVAAALQAGTVWVNCYNVFDSAMPFGGFKESGWGREQGSEVLDLYTEVKSVCVAL